MKRTRIGALGLLVALGVGCVTPPSQPSAPPQAKTPPAAEQAPNEAPSTDLVRGVVKGVGGQALALAHVRMIDLAGEVVGEAQVASDGAFSLPRAEVRGSIAWLELTAVDHRQSKTLIAIEPRPVEVRATLGTYPSPGPDTAVQLIEVKNGRAVRPWIMARQPDGTYSAEVSIDGDKLAYELRGAVGEGRIVNGTMAESYEYDGGGDYVSVVSAPSGKVLVVYDPNKRPPAGAATKIEILPAESTSAKLHEIASKIDANQLARRHAVQAAQAKGGDALIEALKRASEDFRRGLADDLRSNDPIVRHAALVAYFSVAGRGDSGDDSALAETAIRDISPADPVWAIGDWSFANVITAAGGPEKHTAYIQELVDGQPATAPVAAYLAEQLRTCEDPDQARKIAEQLRSKRFAGSPYAMSALRRNNPNRPTAPGKTLPDFEVAALAGKGTFSPAKMRGKLYLIEMWATWCKPCREHLPALHAVFEKYGPKAKGPLHILSISMDESPDLVATFRKDTFPMPWDHALPTNDQKPALRALFGSGIPFYVLIDEKGTVLASTPDLDPGSLGAILAARGK